MTVLTKRQDINFFRFVGIVSKVSYGNNDAISYYLQGLQASRAREKFFSARAVAVGAAEKKFQHMGGRNC